MLVLAVVVWVAAGCGGSGEQPLSKREYQQQVRETGQLFSRALVALGPLGSSSGVKPAQIDKVAKELTRFADRLDEITPPKEIEDAHALFIRGMRDFAHDLGVAADAARKGQIKTLPELSRRVRSLRATKEIQQAANQLRRAGYSFAGS